MIKNIIFDLGGVLFDINYQHIANSFKSLGLGDFEAVYTQLKQDTLFDELETGKISAAEFRNRIRAYSGKPITDQEIDAAWNSILIGFPEENVRLLQKLCSHYRLFLLSNTNEIHEKAFRKMLVEDFGSDLLDALFEKVYLSHRIHLRKPDPATFKLVLEENGLNASETLFIDDSPQHIQGAKECDLSTYWLHDGSAISRHFDAAGFFLETSLSS